MLIMYDQQQMFNLNQTLARMDNKRWKTNSGTTTHDWEVLPHTPLYQSHNQLHRKLRGS